MHRTLGLLFLLASSSAVSASPVFYSNRADFLSSVGASLTDGYSTYTPGVYTDAAMSAVFGETNYESPTFADQNQVGDIFVRGDGSNYCSGCNGNFRLDFSATSFTARTGVFGVGLDIVLHTSRRVSVGDDDPANPSYDGGVEILFADGPIEQIFIPADIGYYDSSTYFLCLSDARGIQRVTIGTEPLAQRHFWKIDNLTIGASAIPTPATLLLLALGLAGITLTRRERLS